MSNAASAPTIGPTSHRRRRLKLTIAAVGVAIASATTALAMPASAAVDAYGVNSRFISIRNNCGEGFKSRGLSYVAVGSYKSGGNWKEWRGSVNCDPWTNKNHAVFAWEPASTTSRVTLEIWLHGNFARRMVIDADTNLCFTVTAGGSQLDATSKAGAGGLGGCTI